MAADADGVHVSFNLWHRATAALHDRFRNSAMAQYGAGLHTECDDCGTQPADVVIPAPRAEVDRTRDRAASHP